MTPRDRLQRLLFEHRTAHDPASSEREILAMFEAVCHKLADARVLTDDMLRYAMAALGTGSPADAQWFRAFWLHATTARDSQETALQTIVSESEGLGLYDGVQVKLELPIRKE